MRAQGFLVALVVGGACSHPASHASDPQPVLEAEAKPEQDTSCKAIVDHEIDVILSTPGIDAATRAQINSERAETAVALVEECEAAAPPPEIRTCMLAATTTDGFGACIADYQAAHRPKLAEGLHLPESADLATFTSDLTGSGPLLAAIETEKGTIHCELAGDKAPMTVANFVGLARGKLPWVNPDTGKVVTDTPFYDGLIFHRVIPEFMIQGGDPVGDGTGGPGYQFDDEITIDLGLDRPGTLAMANSGPGTNGSQFFITEVATDWLTGKHTVFGYCQDLDIVKAIARVPSHDDKPDTTVHIKKITITRGK
jgi:cyclophilin family peptidyl-prolyl cis-trans isomerase